MMSNESREESRRDDDERQKDMMMMAEMTIGRERRMDQLSSSLSSGKSLFLIKSDFPSDLRTGKKKDLVRR